MKTTRTLTIRQALLATVAVAGLVAGTAACGGKNSDTSADAEAETSVAAVASESRPTTTAPTDQLDIVFPETGVETPAAPESETTAPDTEVAPEEAAPDVVTPEEEAAPEAEEESAPEVVTPEEEAAPESGGLDLGDRFPDIDLGGFEPDFDVELPDLPTPDLGTMIITAPTIDFATFWDMGTTTKVIVVVDEGSGHVMSNITSVRVSYRILGTNVTKNAVLGTETSSNTFTWEADGTRIMDGTKVTITVTNAFGLTDTLVITADVSAPL